ncbi:MAG TPA: hypothetical protein DGR97_06100 [Gammaproteobacteria bacterium]|nr:hypothetical protein [Gammaproteobacteria bacterium]|tara:strand:+ start:576 stop:965 length:390 start_codon:yes stop_codon:yes gene_type:complete
MDGIESKKLAHAWVKFQQNWWAWDRLDELCRKDPKSSWLVFTELLSVANGKELLEDIGAGPLEDFINYYASDFIDELESAAASNRAFLTALSFVQLRSPSPDLSDRLEALGCRVSSERSKPDKGEERYE